MGRKSIKLSEELFLTRSDLNSLIDPPEFSMPSVPHPAFFTRCAVSIPSETVAFRAGLSDPISLRFFHLFSYSDYSTYTEIMTFNMSPESLSRRT